MPLRLDSRSSNFTARFSNMLLESRGNGDDVDEVVKKIISNVRSCGDKALVDYILQFDGFKTTPKNFLVEESEIKAGFNACSKDTIHALEQARNRIMEFHERQIPKDLFFTDSQGLKLGYRWNAIPSVGLYVPGGRAAYPSSMLMGAIPAQVAGVKRVVAVVPTPDGILNSLVMAAASILGLTEVYRIGGAHAIAALAYGTETVSRVDKIIGPGNAYVASAKKQVYGDVGIDMFAGPSEILVIADKHNDPNWISMDLLAQAEHDESAKAILITDDRSFAEKVSKSVEAHLLTLPRSSIARKSWDTYGAIITIPSLEEAVPLANQIAAEHVEIATDNAEKLAFGIKNAGAIFLGRYTPEAVGDYVAGPNHILPTSGTSKFSSGLGTLDFMKRTSLIGCDESGLKNVGPIAASLARAEGLDAHASSISIRLKPSE